MMDTIFPISRRKPAAGRQRLTAIVLQIVSLLVFLSLVFFLREFRPEAAGFDEKGALLLLYHVCRLCLMVYIIILCFTAGYRTLQLFRVDPERIFDSARRSFILCFFFGATLYGIGFTILGLLGFINVGTGLASTIPVLLFSHGPIRALFTGSPQAAACRSPGR